MQKKIAHRIIVVNGISSLTQLHYKIRSFILYLKGLEGLL